MHCTERRSETCRSESRHRFGLDGEKTPPGGGVCPARCWWRIHGVVAVDCLVPVDGLVLVQLGSHARSAARVVSSSRPAASATGVHPWSLMATRLPAACRTSKQIVLTPLSTPGIVLSIPHPTQIGVGCWTRQFPSRCVRRGRPDASSAGPGCQCASQSDQQPSQCGS